MHANNGKPWQSKDPSELHFPFRKGNLNTIELTICNLFRNRGNPLNEYWWNSLFFVQKVYFFRCYVSCKFHNRMVVFWTPGRKEILQILLDGFLLLTFFCLFTPWEIPTRAQVPKLIRGWKNARIEGLVTRACSHASLSLELGLNVVIFWEAWKRSSDVLTFTSIWDIIVPINQCRRDQETYQSYNCSL